MRLAYAEGAGVSAIPPMRRRHFLLVRHMGCRSFLLGRHLRFQVDSFGLGGSKYLANANVMLDACVIANCVASRSNAIGASELFVLDIRLG